MWTFVSMYTFYQCTYIILKHIHIFSLWNSIVEPFKQSVSLYFDLHRGSNRCPEGTCDVISLEEIHPDKFCDRQIMELKCYCSNRGCKTQICLKDLEVSECDYA